MKYDVTYSCNHKGVVDLGGKGTDRESMLKWYACSAVCPDCFTKRKEEERKEQKRKDMVITEFFEPIKLVGSDKRIEWASKIRRTYLREAYIIVGSKSRHEKNMLLDLFKKKNSAQYWIINRDDEIKDLLVKYIQQCERESLELSPEAIAVKSEAILSPVDVKYPGSVEIVIIDQRIEVKYVKNDAFIAFVKQCRFRWDPKKICWYRECNQYTGSTHDRAVEVATVLLKEGFAIMVIDEDLKTEISTSEYTSEQTRWITYNQETNDFGFKWDRSKDMYKLVKSIPGCKYKENILTVSIKFWKEVLDFSEINGFKLSAEADKTIARLSDSINIVVPKMNEIQVSDDELAKILASSCEILEDLKDD